MYADPSISVVRIFVLIGLINIYFVLSCRRFVGGCFYTASCKVNSTLLRPVPVGFFCAGHGLVGSLPQLGMGPLELPSHSSQPMAQPTIIV